MFSVTWTKDERSVEFYRDRHRVIVIGFFEQRALFNWAIIWNGKSYAGRFPASAGADRG